MSDPRCWDEDFNSHLKSADLWSRLQTGCRQAGLQARRQDPEEGRQSRGRPVRQPMGARGSSRLQSGRAAGRQAGPVEQAADRQAAGRQAGPGEDPVLGEARTGTPGCWPQSGTGCRQAGPRAVATGAQAGPQAAGRRGPGVRSGRLRRCPSTPRLARGLQAEDRQGCRQAGRGTCFDGPGGPEESGAGCRQAGLRAVEQAAVRQAAGGLAGPREARTGTPGCWPPATQEHT